MVGRCSLCRRATATRETVKRIGTLEGSRVGFVQEARDGVQLSNPVLVCLPCLVNRQHVAA